MVDMEKVVDSRGDKMNIMVILGSASPKEQGYNEVKITQMFLL